VNNQSPYLLVQRFGTELNNLLSANDTSELPKLQRQNITDLKRLFGEARLDVRDYELSETRAEQLKMASAAKKHLKQINGLILAASTYDVFSAIDVASLSSKLEQVIANII
jgi:hypothetical protein